MNAQHTPGPWHIEAMDIGSPYSKEWREIGPNVVSVAEIRRNGESEIGVKIKESDARLIAAAPDLLAALIDCVDAIESSLGLTDYGNTRESDWPELASARAAIAKAKGGEA